MAENHLKAKLKRKKSFIEDHRPENRTHIKLLSSDVTAEPERSVPHAAEWWKRDQLPAVEGLWALTLQAALPYLEKQHCDLVPDLPHPSTGPTTLMLDEERWCDLSEEVAPFPEPSPPSPPSPKTSLSPDPLRLSSSQQDLSAQTKPALDPVDRQLFSHSRQSQNRKTTSSQTCTTRPHHSLQSWVGLASTAGPSSVQGKVRKGGEQRKQTGPVNRQLPTNQVRVSDRRDSLQYSEHEEEMQRSVRGAGAAAAAGGGGGGLHSCPMCLLVFPAGFTQMDCDGHLAQCLSEVNMDVTW